jgi:hypothetical protein
LIWFHKISTGPKIRVYARPYVTWRFCHTK